MGFQTILSTTAILLLATPTGVFADLPDRIPIRVVDEQGEPIEGATVEARYLKTIRQDGKDYRVPMELAPPQTTDMNGRCELALHVVSWTLAGLYAHRVELTTDEAMKLCDDAPRDPLEREAFDRDLNDRCQRFRSAYRVLTSEPVGDAEVTLKMARAIRVTGRVQVSGSPLAKAFITIHSRKTQIDQLFPRSAPELTDDEGRFSFYSVPGDLDRARIVVERSSGNRVLTLSDIRSKPTSTGVMFEFDTEVKDYALVVKP
ncbi:hypothetical protein [Rubripirellula reticaptiva]|uniref:Nickel uptake substrate-specific transmembrane region n=1 Tax=Rubripirellula reticaptiva TaxID=2528013 RepID=A0A5C6EWA1_9BACT|nr:hypothetical protein [Rubripirellula reticaptiva]TWU51511.1 hypothetical protein Poly59_31030 [Rubripirellula reticaptiva]